MLFCVVVGPSDIAGYEIAHTSSKSAAPNLNGQASVRAIPHIDLTGIIKATFKKKNKDIDYPLIIKMQNINGNLYIFIQ